MEGRPLAAAFDSRRAGFLGANCAHPALVEVLNEGFSPSAEEVNLARRQPAAAEGAARDGRGSFAVELLRGGPPSRWTGGWWTIRC